MTRWIVPFVLAGCLERVTGEEVPLDSRFTAQPTATSSGSDTGAPAHNAQEHTEVPHKEEDPPQPFEDVEGEKIVVAGQVISPSEGSIDLDVSVVDDTAPGGLVRSGKLILDQAGEFSLSVPQSIGWIQVAAFQDLEKDGPSEEDPYAEIRIEVGTDPIADIELTLVVGGRTTTNSGPVHKEVPPPQPFSDAEGEKVTLSGTIRSERMNPVDLDVGRKDESSPGGVTTEGKLVFPEPGVFSLEVPVNVGSLRLAAFQDLEQDGPSAKDPYAELLVEVGSSDISGIEFDLVVGSRDQGAGGGPEHVEAPPGFGSGQAPPPTGSPTQSDPFAAVEGNRVPVSGVIVWEGDQVVDLDLFTPDASAGGGRRLLGKLKKDVGAFVLQVPISLGVLELDAFADLTGDGPTADDPRSTIRNISLTDGPVSDVRIILASMVEDAPPTIPEGGGTDIEEEFARTVGSGPVKKQTGEGL